jgi:hypothetical protein
MSAIAQSLSNFAYNQIMLGAVHRAQVRSALLHLAADWKVELVDDTTIMVSPLDGEDINGPTIVVSTDGHRFRIDGFRWDTYWNIAGSVAWPDVLRTVRVAATWETSISQMVQ